MDEVAKKKTSKILNTCLYVFFALFILVGSGAIIFRITTRNNNGSFSLGNIEYRLMVNKSMNENARIDVDSYKTYDIHEIRLDSLLKVKKIGDERKTFYNNLKVGDVITYNYFFKSGEYAGKEVIVANRLIEKLNDEEHAGEYILKCAGDKETSLDDKNVHLLSTYEDKTSRNYVTGIVKNTNLPLGKVLTFLTSNLGIILLIITPSAIFFLYEIGRVIVILRKDHLEKVESIHQEKNDEIASLKKQIEELQKEKEEKK